MSTQQQYDSGERLRSTPNRGLSPESVMNARRGLLGFAQQDVRRGTQGAANRVAAIQREEEAKRYRSEVRQAEVAARTEALMNTAPIEPLEQPVTLSTPEALQNGELDIEAIRADVALKYQKLQGQDA